LSRRDLWEPEGEIPSGYPTLIGAEDNGNDDDRRRRRRAAIVVDIFAGRT
jgi:hypothetical protein